MASMLPAAAFSQGDSAPLTRPPIRDPIKSEGLFRTPWTAGLTVSLVAVNRSWPDWRVRVATASGLVRAWSLLQLAIPRWSQLENPTRAPVAAPDSAPPMAPDIGDSPVSRLWRAPVVAPAAPRAPIWRGAVPRPLPGANGPILAPLRAPRPVMSPCTGVSG